jgi:glycerol-3-phosphate acyltransferase PlsY
MEGILNPIVALVAYLVGSIPFGFLIAKSRGIDIRQHGSGNIGATNVFRTLGKKWGIACFACDFLKGLVAVLIAFGLSGGSSVAGIIAAVACIVGHNFPVWLKFKGGKGIATSGGVLVALLPGTALLLIIVWAAIFYTTRYVSLASIAVAVALPVIVLISWLTERGADLPLFLFALAVAVLAVWRHRSNISRLMNGTENRFERKKKR